MGGNAFAHAASTTSPTLYTPRMTPEKYTQLKQLYEGRLRKCLPDRKINTLKEAPQKTSYGDLDFLVESADDQVDWLSLARQLGAAGIIIHSSGKVQSCSLAVLMDGSPSSGFSIYKHQHDLDKVSKVVTSVEYAQLDLEVVPRELFEWHSFYSSNGDMGGLLGHMVHNLGFTVCDKGLMLRLAACDAAKDMVFVNVPDKAGRLYLSKDPEQVLSFLGLSFEVYQQGFTAIDDFYQWLSQCTLLSKDSVKVKRDDASGRQKERKRPLYSNFFNTWLPEYLSSGDLCESTSKPSRSRQRQDLELEAVTFFDKKAEFEQMNAALVQRIQTQTVEYLIKPIVAQHSGFKDKKLVEIVRAFRRWVGFREGGDPYILSTPHDDEHSELVKLLSKEDKTILQDQQWVSEWVKGNWEVLKGLERERAKRSVLPA